MRLVICWVWQKDRRLRDALNVEWERMFPDPADRPARHVVIRDWPGEALIRIEIMAIVGHKRRTIVELPGAALGGGGARGSIPLAAAIGPVMFTAAIAGWDRREGHEPDDPEQQTRFAFANLEAVLDAGGFSISDLRHAFLWQRDHRARGPVDETWNALINGHSPQPARHDIMVPLPLNLVAQIEAIAISAQASRGIADICFIGPVAGGSDVQEAFATFAGSSRRGDAAQQMSQNSTFGSDRLNSTPKSTRQSSTLAGQPAARHDILLDLPGGVHFELSAVAMPQGR